MTIEEVNEYYRGTKEKTVLVAVQDLEKDDVVEFTKRNKDEIARVSDNFINQLRVFTEKQSDIRNILPRGKLSTILLKE